MLIAQSRACAAPTVMLVNDAFVRLTGFSPGAVIGKPCTFMHGPGTDAATSAELQRAIVDRRCCDIDLLHYRSDGGAFWNGITLSPAFDPATGITTFLFLMRDVTARRRADDRMAAMADHLRDLAMSDPLTGIGNRRSFDAALEREWHRCSRSGGTTTLAMIDIDHFKPFNDQFGHPAGDACLKAVAEALGGAIRQQTDVLTRYGGEEFAVLMPELPLDNAAAMGARLVEAVRQIQIAHPQHRAGRITISCGVISVTPSQFEGGAPRFVQEADHALYRAKAAGRDCVHAVVR
jgi:diguanylate cyclase (GGDEF)-like protein/PAS domain S-box-containing protein